MLQLKRTEIHLFTYLCQAIAKVFQGRFTGCCLASCLMSRYEWCQLLVGIHEYIFQKISALFFNRSSTENLSPAWVSWIIPSRSSKPAEIIYLSTFQVIFTIKKNPCIYIMCVCFGRAPEQRKWSPVMHPKKEIAIFEMYYFHFLSSLLICTMLFFKTKDL